MECLPHLVLTPSVPGVVVVRAETLTTDPTLVRRLACVKSLMVQQDGSLGKLLATEGAFLLLNP